MKIVIPMSGQGSRFLRAGYTAIKPLIPIDKKPMIARVVGMFPDTEEFIFICNRDHLRETPLRSVLEKLKPRFRIVDIEKHKKGPVYAVTFTNDLLDDNEEVIVNYCDFFVLWDYARFLKTVREGEYDGALTAYRGFHPHHLSPEAYYAYIQEIDRELLAIKEKEPFTQNRMEEYASTGTYYFAKGSYVKRYFKQLMDEGTAVQGEYYVSLVYNLMKRDRLSAFIYEINTFIQWGTPRDVETYHFWSEYFAGKAAQTVQALP